MKRNCEKEMLKKKTKIFGIVVILVLVLAGCASGPPANALGEVEASFESRDAIMFADVDVGVNLIAAAALDAINAPATIRLNTAAREALLVVARAQHGPNVDVTRVRHSFVGQNPQTGLYQYIATGWAVFSE